MSAETCAEHTQSAKSADNMSANKKKSGCAGLGKHKKRVTTADATAHDCCRDGHASEALPSSTGLASEPARPESAPAMQPGKHVCKGDSE